MSTGGAGVAPPRGERGLKRSTVRAAPGQHRRSPSWGAWIETVNTCLSQGIAGVAPPRGERGLKQRAYSQGLIPRESLPLVGSVD